MPAADRCRSPTADRFAGLLARQRPHDHEDDPDPGEAERNRHQRQQHIDDGVSAVKLRAPDGKFTVLPIVKRSRLLRLMRHPKLPPDQGQCPRHQHRDDEQHRYEDQREAGVAAAIEQNPGHQREPGDEPDGGAVDPGMELIEHRLVLGDEFPAHWISPLAVESLMQAIKQGRGSCGDRFAGLMLCPQWENRPSRAAVSLNLHQLAPWNPSWRVAVKSGPAMEDPMERRITRDDVIHAVGSVDDVTVAKIIATGATIEELAEAQAW